MPLWNPHVACGQPLYANHQIGITNPLILLCYYVFPGLSAFTAVFFSVFVLMGWGTYAYLRIIGLSRWPSLIAAVSYQFMLGYIPTLDTLVVEKTLFPFLLYSVERIVRARAGKGAPWVVLATVLLALVQTSAHVQEAVFISYLLGPYILFVAGGPDAFPRGAVWKTIGKRVLLAAGVYIPALLLGMVQNLPTYEFYNLSTRSGGFKEQIQSATPLEVDLTWIQSLMIAFPRLFGDYLKPYHFLEHYLLNYGYIGMVSLLAGLFAGWIRPNRRQVWFWGIVALVFFVAIISNWFYFEILCRLPLFRVSLQKPYSPLFFSLIVLGGHGLSFFLQPQQKEGAANRLLGRMALLVYGSTISLGILWGVYLAMPRSPDIEERTYVFSQLLIGGLVASAACLVVSLLWRYVNEKAHGDISAASRAVTIASIAMLAVVLLDLWPVKAHFNPFVKRKDLFFPTPATDFLEANLSWKPGEADGPYRFARSWKEVLPPNTGMMYGLDDFGGYDSNLVGRYGALMQAVDPSIMEEIHYIETPRRRAPFESRVWNMLGVKYVLAHRGHMGQFEPAERWHHDYVGDVLIVRNADALPRMIVVENVTPIEEDAEALEKVVHMDPAAEAVVVRDGPLPYDMPPAMPDAGLIERGSPGNVAITGYEPERVTAHVSLTRPALLCFFDVYYPGWEVSVDGRPADLERVDYTFKGVFVPSGEHEVVFRYRPASLREGLILSLAGLLLACIVAVPISRIAGSRSGH
jgi:hypothetical protein